jgi:LuxR family maltose regulon positive regulatory protein
MGIGLRDALNREDRPTLERWLRLLPEEMIQRQPELLMVRAWAYQFSWRLDLQAKAIQQAEALLDAGAGASLPADELQVLRAQIPLLRAEHAYFNNQQLLAIDLCRQVLELLPPAWTFARGGAMIYLGMSMQASGQAAAAERQVLDEYEAYGNKGDVYALFLLQSLCFVYLQAGQLDQARQTALLMVQVAAQGGLALKNYWGDWFLGVVCYQRNELEAAAQYFAEIFENRYVAQLSVFRDAVAGLALIHQIRGEGSQAWELAESISAFDLEQSGTEDNRTRSLRARLMLSRGDLESACQWAETVTGPPPDKPLLWFEEPQVTRARILVARGTDADLHAALQILDVLQEIAERTHNARYRIEILALRALALDAQGEMSEAEATLNQALELAKVGGFIRAFADLGKPMQDMINRLAGQDHAAGTMQRILAAFPQDGATPAGGESRGSRSRHASLEIPGLAERLTPRELEVLDLLRGPLSIKQIALELSISHATAKRHAINLYHKLGVNSRREATARAEELEILPPR